MGWPAKQSEGEVGSKYLESGRKYDFGSQHNSTDSFSIRQLLNVQQMAIVETNQTGSLAPSPRKNGTNGSRFPTKRKKPSMDGKKAQKEKFEPYEP